MRTPYKNLQNGHNTLQAEPQDQPPFSAESYIASLDLDPWARLHSPNSEYPNPDDQHLATLFHKIYGFWPEPQSQTSQSSSLYHELIYAVEQKYEGETRHQTALRYIRERENRIQTHCADSQFHYDLSPQGPGI